jgi:hypothetical protein
LYLFRLLLSPSSVVLNSLICLSYLPQVFLASISMAYRTSFTYSLHVFSFLLHLFQLFFTSFSIVSDVSFSSVSHFFHLLRSSLCCFW